MNAAALTGGIASGKSAAAHILERLGVATFDTDHAAASLTATGGRAINALKQAFGDVCMDASGALDRLHMRERVFRDPEARRLLESILHPMIREEVDAFLQAAGSSRCVVMIPLFFESMSYRERFREVVSLDCPLGLQIHRLVTHRKLAHGMAEQIIASQVPRRVRLQLADRVLCNGGSLDALETQVSKWLGEWR